MISIFRSAKFIKYYAGFARSYVLSSSRGVLNGVSLHNNLCGSTFSKKLATQAIPSYNIESNLDKSLRRLDQDVRRTGRISRKELEDVLEELRQTGSVTSTQALLIIRCCGNLVPEESPQVRTQLVQEIWKTLENISVPMDISHYNALLRVYLENEHKFSPTEFLTYLEHKGVEPNRVTYQRLIACYCQQGDIEGATRILEFMREKQLPVNENVFNALITGHSQADDMDSAAGILEVMRQAGLEPSADTYTTLLCGYARKGNIEAIMSTIEECENKDIYLTDKDYMDVIYALAKSNHGEHVDKVIAKLRKSAGYNQDAVNLILRLINNGHEEIAYKIFQTMPRPVRTTAELPNIGSFFIRQLVKANRPIETIIAYCDRFAKDNFNSHALLVAAETSLQLGNINQAKELLKAMNEREFPIRQHYFWPLLARCDVKNNTKPLEDILLWMTLEMKVPIGGETLRDYVIPHFQGVSNDKMITLLKSWGVSIGAAASAIVSDLLNKGEIAEAAKIAMKYRSYYSVAQLRRPLVQAYLRTEDADSFVTILRQIQDSVGNYPAAEEETPTAVPDRAEIVGQIVNEVANSKKNRSDRIEAILQKLVDQGIGLSNSSAELLQEKLGGELTSNISNLLSTLTSRELLPAPVTRPSTVSVPMDEVQLLRLQKTLEEKGESTKGVKRQLFYLHCKNKDLDKVQKIVQELETDGFILTNGMYAQLIDLYVQNEKLEEAMSVLNILHNREPDFNLDDLKRIRIVDLMVKNDKVTEAIKFLSDHPRDSKVEVQPFGYNSACWRLLNSLAEQGKKDELSALFNALVQNGHIEVNNVLLGPLVKVHLVRDDLPEAMKAFEWCCETYRSTPLKNELAQKMIQAEDAVLLQKLTDLGTQIHGEVNSLYDLVLSFVECGKIRQARKILETPGLRSRPQRLNFACARYHQEGMVAPLEGLVEATRDISHIDRGDIFYHLLLTYCKLKDADKALGLWTRMQEEDVQPSEEFLATLGTFLKNEGRDIPFKIPDIVPTNPEQEQSIKETNAPSDQLMRAFRRALQSGNTDECLKLKRRIEDSKNSTLTVNELSALLENLVKQEELKKASKLTIEMLERGVYPFPRIFRFLTNRLAAGADIHTLQKIGNLINPEQKKKIMFDNRLCNAYSAAGKGQEYLQMLEQEIDKAGGENLEPLSEKFPRGGVLGLLNKNPELVSHYEQLAIKYAEKGIPGPVNILWIHYFAEGKEAAAETLWKKYLCHSPRIMFKQLLVKAREEQNEEVPKKIIKLCEESPISDRAKGTLHSCLIDILVSQQKHDEALLAVKEAIKDVCLENLNRTALKRLQQALQLQGKEFPFVIPDKDSSSSSSSSDDEKMIEKKS